MKPYTSLKSIIAELFSSQRAHAIDELDSGKQVFIETISPEFTFTDALLLFSIGYCQRHNYKATLGHILLETDAINREQPMARELENGLSRLIVGKYIEIQNETFVATKAGVRLFNDVTKPRIPKLTALQEIRNLTARLNSWHLRTVTKQLTITDTQYAEAIQESHKLFDEAMKKADEILKARKVKESS